MKKSRHQKIVDIISTYDIETQEDLAEKLCAAGFVVTQATVSRDIRELGLTKMPISGGKQKYVLLKSSEDRMGDKYNRVLKEGLLSMDMAQNILVVKTVSGMAMAVAAALDAMQMKEIVGTIDGDDTIMMAIRTVEDTKQVMETIKEMIE